METMKHVLLSFSLLLVATTGYSQTEATTRYLTRSAAISFFSSTPIEDIEAHSVEASAVLDGSNGAIAFQVPLRSFHFEKALMEEHFNEKYVESDRFPKATFRGRVVDWGEAADSAQAAIGVAVEVVASGRFELHGVSVEREAEGTVMWTGSTWKVAAAFVVAPADHEIDIPSVVRDKIGKSIDVEVSAELVES